MTLDAVERVAALAPHPSADRSLDPEGLTLAFATLERDLAAERRAAPVSGRARSPHTRHLRRAALAGAGALALTAGAIVVPAQLHSSLPGTTHAAGPFAPAGALTTGLLPAAAAADGHCTSADLEDDTTIDVPREAWTNPPIASALALLRGSARPDGVWAYESPRLCPTAVASAVVYDTTGTRGLNVYRDVAADDYLPNTKTDANAVALTVRGVRADALSWMNGERPRQRITWVDATGVRWYAVADGLPQATTVHLLDGLVFDADGHLQTSSVPKGYRSAAATDPVVGTEPSYQWTVQYAEDKSTYVTKGNGTYEVPSPEYRYLSVTTPAIEPIEARVAAHGGSLVTFDGARAAWSPSGEGGARLTWIKDGAVYQLAAPVTSLDAMLALARTVQHVKPDDPRLG